MEKSQQGSKSWKDNIGTFIAITTVVLAVCATLAAFKAAGYGNKMVLMQSQASDQWAYYQAKSIKETTYQVQRDAMALAAQEAGKAEQYKSKVDEYDKEVARYKQEKKEITDEAKRLEKDRDMAQRFNGKFGQALIFLQIGILLSSLASINKVYLYWYMGLFAGGVGIVMFLYTFASSIV
ncbi:hypothetical protein SPSIL_012450 [Sporomusa silvacetica DSM 10669]|uniref:DUF4337 domain-containing protein n=1 Tax=Sporomusa silvacetica DSM 10669 TaxID=1123289 RepID=A0ABZ3IHI1_9FIRM|nr:DUF4337 domain-containing protein [Sporomusa silvacetica]OZC17461.1 hypothetical protein SPSIL_32720 [Sporomusa silvacetica DSM 10669]